MKKIHWNGATIGIGQEIQRLPYAGFFFNFFIIFCVSCYPIDPLTKSMDIFANLIEFKITMQNKILE